MNSYQTIWQAVLIELRAEFSDADIAKWFSDAEIAAIEPQYIIIFSKDAKNALVVRSYTRKIESYLHTVLRDFHMVFIFAKDTYGAYLEDVKKVVEQGIDQNLRDDVIYEMASGVFLQRDPTKRQERPAAPTYDLSNLGTAKISVNSGHIAYNDAYTFDNFVRGSSNIFAFNACVTVATTLYSAWNPLFIYGPSGLGKTHLLYAITNKILENKPDANVIYVKGEEFTNELIESLRGNDNNIEPMMRFRNKYRYADVLLVDDVQFIAGKTSTQVEFFHTFNFLYENKKQIILTSDRPPRDISVLEERMRTRFEWGLTASIEPPDYELRAAIIRSKAEEYGLSLPSDVENFLAENMKDNVRQIEGALKKLFAYSSLNSVPVSLDLARSLTHDMLSIDISPQQMQERILDCVSRHFRVSAADIRGSSRTKDIMFARHVAIYLMRNMIPSASLKQIGAVFGRDHTTVLNSIDVISKKVSQDPYFEREMSEMQKEIKG